MPEITKTLYEHAKTVIPAGTQLFSKRPEKFAPGQWPAYFKKAVGCEVWDLDDNHYYDFTSNGISSCLLGYADPDVSEAVIDRIRNGSMCTLNPPEEVELADKLCEIHNWAEMARFARTGGEICSIAVRIARATTGRDKIAICGYHGWSDWYLAANLGDSAALDGQLLPGLSPVGVPKSLRGSAVTFKYNDRAGFDAIMETYGNSLAAVIMEPVRSNNPDSGFLEHIRERTRKSGVLLIFDEITIGWKLTFGGAHLTLGLTPDIAVFAKALGNGHPIAAVIGSKEAMDGAETSFISSTYWTESVGPVAALATVKKMEKTRVWEHVDGAGKEIKRIWRVLADKYDLPVEVDNGFPCLAQFKFTQYSLELRTLFTVLMLRQGFLATTLSYPTLAHTAEMLEKYYSAVDIVFSQIKDILRAGDVEKAIGGPVCHTDFRRLVT